MCPRISNDDCGPKCGSIDQALSIIGDKWSGQIVRELTAGAQRFGELEQGLRIGPRTLSQRLDVLEQKGVLTKKTYAEAPPRVEYSLTQKGEDLLPILKSMAEWGTKYK